MGESVPHSVRATIALMGTKNGSVTNRDQMTPRQEQVAEMRKRGATLEKMAKEIGVSVFTVHSDLKRVREIWKERQAMHYDEIVAEATVRFEHYLDKLAPRVDAGQPAAIDVAIRAEDRYARLVGIDKPVEHKVTVSIEAIDNRIAELEAKQTLPVLEGEVISDEVD